MVVPNHYVFKESIYDVGIQRYPRISSVATAISYTYLCQHFLRDTFVSVMNSKLWTHQPCRYDFHKYKWHPFGLNVVVSWLLVHHIWKVQVDILARDRLSWLSIFMVFLCLSTQISRCFLNLGHACLSSNPFWFIYSLTTWSVIK
jgi:hypothetical protein